MARSLKRRNLFINILKQQTLQYMKAETQELKNKLRKIVVNSKDIVSKQIKHPFSQLRKRGVITYYYKGQKVGENSSNFGKVVANEGSIVDRTLNIEKSLVNKYTELIFAESQRLVPIDKRYAFVNVRDKKSVKIKNYRSRGIIDIKGMKNIYSLEDFSDIESLRNFRRLYYSDEDDKNLSELGIKIDRSKGIEFGSGWYSGKQADFIKQYLYGTNHKAQFNIYYDSSENKIYKRDNKRTLSFSPVTGVSLKNRGKNVYNDKVISVDKQPTGGFQELKSGGRIDKEGYGYKIIYSAFDETKPKGNRYNYAALQHDNLAFKHKYGESMYLSNAVMKYKDKLYKEHNKRVIKSIKGV